MFDGLNSKCQSDWSLSTRIELTKPAGAAEVDFLDPDGLVRGNEPDAKIVRISEEGMLVGEGSHVIVAELVIVAVSCGALKGRGGWGVRGKRGRGDIEVGLAHEGRRGHQRAALDMRSIAVKHRHLLSTVVESGSAVESVGLRDGCHRQLLADVEVGRVELREGLGTFRVVPPHARSELSDSVNGELHEGKRSLSLNPGAGRATNGHQTTRNLLNRDDGKATKVGGTNVREETLHQESNGVEVSNNHEGVGGALEVLKRADGHPEEPAAEGLESVKLLVNGQSGDHLAIASEEANKMLHLGVVLIVVAQVGLNLHELVDGSLVSDEVILARLAGAVLRRRRSRSRGECAALSDEVGEQGLVLPLFHGINDSGGSLHELGPAVPVRGQPGKNQRGGKDGVRCLAREGSNGSVETANSQSTVLRCHVLDTIALSHEGNVHGREGQNRMHNVRSGGSDAKQVGDMASPEREVVGVDAAKLMVNRRNMVDEAKLSDRVRLRHRHGVDTEGRKGKDASALPLKNSSLDLRSPHQIGHVGSSRALRLGNLDIVVRAANLMLGAVVAVVEVSRAPWPGQGRQITYH